MFEEQLAEKQGTIDSLTFKNQEIHQLYAEVAEKYDNADSTVKTLNDGHSMEVTALRHKLTDSQEAYAQLEAKYLHLESQQKTERETEDVQSSDNELESLRFQVEEAVVKSSYLEQANAALKEETEKKENTMREKLMKKKTEVLNLKEAVKRYTSECDQLQQDLTREKQLRQDLERRLEDSQGSEGTAANSDQKLEHAREIERLKHLLDVESSKCLRLGAELKNLQEKHIESHTKTQTAAAVAVVAAAAESEKVASAHLEPSSGDEEETLALRKALAEAQTKIENLEQTVELLKENNKVIGELREDLEQEKSKSTRPNSSRSPAPENGELDDLRRELLIEKAKRSELEQSYHSLQSSREEHMFRCVRFC